MRTRLLSKCTEYWSTKLKNLEKKITQMFYASVLQYSLCFEKET